MLFRYYPVLVLLLLAASLSGQQLAVADWHYGIDEEARMIVCRADLEAANQNTSGNWISVLTEARMFRLRIPEATLMYGKIYEVDDEQNRAYQLHFTELPLVHLQPQDSIIDAEKRPATVVYADGEQTITRTAGVEIRGGYTSELAKKTYDLEFWTDASGTENTDVSFGGLRSDDDWILDAVYNEPLRVNAFVAHQLWDDIYALPYAADEPRARAGVGVRWCEVFLGGRYHGLYFLSEQVDRKQLRLKKYREETNEVRGELYKSVFFGTAVEFTYLPPRPTDAATYWKGLEPKYPDRDGARWGELHEFFAATIGSRNSEFDRIFEYWLDLDNLVDYFLFINLIAAEDNMVKNIYYARRDADSPYLMIPWDLDGSFGNRWNGENVGFEPNAVITNRLFDRVIDRNAGGFAEALCTRFQTLEARGLFTADSLNARLATQLHRLDKNGIYNREAERWPGSVRADAAQRAYTYRWNEDRLDFLRRWSCDFSLSNRYPLPNPPAIVVMPNPTTGYLRVRTPDGLGTPYVLLDLVGREMLRGTINDGDDVVVFNQLPPGPYFLRIGDEVVRIILQ